MINFKTLISFFLCCFILSGCLRKKSQNNEHQIPADIVYNPNTADGDADTSRLPRITFEKEMHDFGRLIEGEVVSYSFKFKNTGSSDLLITTVSASCGCTVPKYPRLPVKPGAQDYIVVSFNTKGRKGFQHKKLAVISNTQPNNTIIEIKAQVYTPEE